MYMYLHCVLIEVLYCRSLHTFCTMYSASITIDFRLYKTNQVTPGAPNSAKFRGGGGCGGLAKIQQMGVGVIFSFLRDKNIIF